MRFRRKSSALNPPPKAPDRVKPLADDDAAERGAACHAPFTSMHLDPSGRVRVCELNSLGMLGVIPESSLLELWHGGRARRVRSALRKNDLALGCESCAPLLESGDRQLAHAAYYDQFDLPGTDAPEWPVQLELSLTNACNLQCVMCDGDLSSAIRAHREHLPPLPKVYDDAFFNDLRLFLPHLQRITFIGGEPFLGVETYRVFDMLTELERPPDCWVTTNGTVFNDRVKRILAAVPFDVSISIDGATAGTYESIREGSSYDKVIANIDRFRNHAARVSLNFCLMVPNWFEFHAFLKSANEDGLDVHVNIVTAPKRYSLYQLPATELVSIVAELQRIDAGDLGRNRRVWDEQLARLQGHLQSLTTATPVAHPRRAAAPTGGSDSQLPPGEAIARWADDRGVAALSVGRSEVILGATPDASNVLGMDLRPLIGGHLTGMVAMLQQAFGDLQSSRLARRTDGSEDRTMTFRRGGSVTTVRALLIEGDPGQHGAELSRWLLAAQTTRSAPPADHGGQPVGETPQ